MAENSAVGSAIGSIGASDGDAGVNGKIRYSIVGTYYDHVLAIDSQKGHLSVAGSLDRESKAFHLFWVQVSDIGGLNDFCQVNLTVTGTVLEQALL